VLKLKIIIFLVQNPVPENENTFATASGVTTIQFTTKVARSIIRGQMLGM